MNRKAVQALVLDYGDKVLLGAALALLLSSVVFSVLFAKDDPNLDGVRTEAKILNQNLDKGDAPLEPIPAATPLKEAHDTISPPVPGTKWLFEVQPFIMKADAVKPVTPVDPPKVKKILPPPALDTLEATMEGVRVTWKIGDPPKGNAAPVAPIKEFLIERKGPKDKNFAAITKPAIPARPADQPQSYDYKDKTALSDTEYEYRVTAFTEDKEAEAQSAGGFSLPSAPKKIKAAGPYQVRVNQVIQMDNNPPDIEVIVKWFIPELSAEKDSYYYRIFRQLKKGDIIGRKDNAFGHEFGTRDPIYDPKTKQPFQWDFTTGLKITKIEQDASITGDIKTLECDPKYRYDRTRNPNPPADCPQPTVAIKKKVQMTVKRITCVDTKHGNKIIQIIDKWYDGPYILIDSPHLLCPQHGGLKPPPPAPPKPPPAPPKPPQGN